MWDEIEIIIDLYFVILVLYVSIVAAQFCVDFPRGDIIYGFGALNSSFAMLIVSELIKLTTKFWICIYNLIE